MRRPHTHIMARCSPNHPPLHRAFCSALLLACLIIPAVAQSNASAQLKVDNFKFGPDKLTVTKGTDVTWTNQDDIPHSIVLTALGIRSQVLDTDKTFSYRFDKAGTFTYICGLHPFMHGQVVVK
jgi:plastocyanin